ncbi:MAG: PLP-dependent aminotransferase family protein [Holophagales bacterium]|nr:PLP-dependent aminotransferase family protein [Holophagales bacterium]
MGGLSPVHLDPGSPIPLHRQIYEALRRDILGGSLPSGQRLLATRAMATELGVSRNTVLEAVEQLIAEGYLTARRGSGTFVASDLPEELLRVAAPSRPTGTGALPPLSTRGRALGRLLPAAEDRSRPFQLGRPALDRFPWRTWSRLLARRSREVPREWLDYGDPAGYPPLRRALAHYLRASRGLRCVPEQIVIVRGSQQGIDLAARVLLDEGDPVWMEDPGYPAARLALSAAGAREVSVPLDAEGLDLEEGQVREPGARLVYVTPSHQYPLGVTLSLPRRLELLRWARQNGAWILEDDYDSEYRYAGRPLASLAGLDGGPEGSRHVIYLGTLSKVLFPALRLGYLVVPIEYVDAFVGARFANDRHTGLLEQAVVADFFAHGHFERHVRRMRQLYAERQRVLRQAMAEHLADEIELRPSDTGLHTLGTLRRGRDAEELSARAAEAGITVRALSAYCRRARLPPGLLFGYAGHPTAELRAAVERLARVMGSR